MVTQVPQLGTAVDSSPSISTEKIPQEQLSSEPLIVADWIPEAETKLRRKLDFTILPILILGLFALQLDKSNISYALATSFTKDLGIDNNNVNYGNQLMLAAIVIFEIPSNMVLSRIVATAQTAIHNLAGFYATRFILGMWEAGYFAASLTILASFYTRREMAMRVTLTLLDPPLMMLLVRIGCSSLVVYSLSLSASFSSSSCLDTVPLCGFEQLDFFNDEERRILNNRVVLDDPRKVVRLSGIGPKRAFRIVLTSFRISGHFGINVIPLTPKGGLGVYSPTIIKNLGFSATTASFLSYVHHFGVCIFAILVAWIKYTILTILTSGMAVSKHQRRLVQCQHCGSPRAMHWICIGCCWLESRWLVWTEYLCSLYLRYVLIAGMTFYYWNDNRRLAKGSGNGKIITEEGVVEVGGDSGASKVKNQL
ncbi:hypothetical protein LCI18_002577 [Fusarium solani-melongenae]|uniref:Uncharacterized protein n=2 Tax=Fusarium solani subsp. cucurbitae TaxID=2747967 RepID=A0ACD3YR20_FUSSC|nr:hypothetical protein LCI18_002238 [Fusarium solani-melongenae]UPK91642.1 hypothetical protein LCI18_002577 [Fusarium solani-melongenae]